MSLATCLYVTLGGALGTLTRYLLSVLALPISHRFPWATLIANVTGCALIGFVGTLTLAHGRYPLSENMRLFLMVGFCGGYTTFSAFGLQTLDLIRNGATARAMLNVVASVFLCLIGVAIGHWAAETLNDNAREIAQLEIEEEA